jgi:hypothetical protein
MTLAELEARSTESLLDSYRECYKSLHNVNPRGMPSREELIQFWLTYDADFAAMSAQEKAEEAKGAERLEADIANLLATMPKASRDDAIRLLIQSIGGQDEECLEYEYGTRFGYLKAVA